jgi:ABC-type lipoprotein export system ATPase subunit
MMIPTSVLVVTHDEKITKKSERRFGIADGFLEGST